MVRKTILLADDDSITLKLLEQILKEHGFLTIKAINGKEAIEKAQEEHPALIILDIDMPLVGGSEVAEALKEEASTAQIPIIFLTGMLLKTEEKSLGYQVGEAFLIAKPFDPKVLINEIKKRV